MPTDYHSKLQQALWQAAKVGHFNLMQELIAKGANPFIHDNHGRNAISYAITSDLIKAGSWVIDLLLAINRDGDGDE